MRVNVAVCDPTRPALNVTLMTQLWLGFTEVPQVVLDTENWFKLSSPPVIFQERLMSAPVPVFETVTGFVELLPMATVPKLMEVGLKLTVGEFTVWDTPADVLPLKLVFPP